MSRSINYMRPLEVCEIDEVDTPGRNTDTSVDGEEVDDGPPLPPRTPAPQVLREPEPESTITRGLKMVTLIDPIQVVKTEATPTSLSPGVRRAMATPRSRGGLMVSAFFLKNKREEKGFLKRCILALVILR